MTDAVKMDKINNNIMTLVGTEETYKHNDGDSKEVINAKAEGMKRVEYTRELLKRPEKLGAEQMAAIQGYILVGIDYQDGFSKEVLEKAKAAKTEKDKIAILEPLFKQIPDEVMKAYTSLGGSQEALHMAYLHAADRTFFGNVPDAEKANVAAALAPVKNSLTVLADAARSKLIEKMPEVSREIMDLVGKENAEKAVEDLKLMLNGDKKAEKELQTLIGKGLDGSIKYTGGAKPFSDDSDRSIATAKELAAKAGLSDDFSVDLKKGYEGKEDKTVALEDVMKGIRKAIEDAQNAPGATTKPSAPTREAKTRS